MLLAATPADAQEFPTFNIRKYCFEQTYAARGSIGSPAHARCVSDEIAAADRLNASWELLPPSLRRGCMPPPPSQSQPEKMTGAYGSMLDCIQRRLP